MTVLIAYATSHGSTRGVAERIADRLRDRAIDAVVLPVDQVEGVREFEAVVLGSAVHDQSWLPEATAFVRRNEEALASRPVWLFSVSSVGDRGSFFPSPVARLLRAMRKEPEPVAGLRTALHALGHRGFAGAIERAHYPLVGHLFMKALGGRYGDHRDWPDIDAWADGIARELASSLRGAR